MGLQHEEEGRDQFVQVNVIDLRDTIKMVVETSERQEAIERRVAELGGSIGSISGELGQIKEALQKLTEAQVSLNTTMSATGEKVQEMQSVLDDHIDRSRTLVEASDQLGIVVSFGGLLWRMKWWITGTLIIVTAVIKRDWASIHTGLTLLLQAIYGGGPTGGH